MGVIIDISYLLNDELKWNSLQIKDTEYFEDFDKSKSIFDMIEIHFLEPRNYIKVERQSIKFLIIHIKDNFENQIITKYTYWENGESQIKEYIEIVNEKVVQKSIIQSVYINDDLSLILRLDEENGILFPVTDELYSKKEDMIIDR